MDNIPNRSCLKKNTLQAIQHGSKKTVSFAPLASAKVYFIATGTGTWDNGQARADNPTPYEIANMSRLAAQTLAQIEHNEKAGTQVKRKPLVRGTPYYGTRKEDENARVPSQPGDSVTFDSFVPQEKLRGDYKRPRASAKSISSLASLKSLSKKFKQRLIGGGNEL